MQTNQRINISNQLLLILNVGEAISVWRPRVNFMISNATEGSIKESSSVRLIVSWRRSLVCIIHN